MRAGSIPALEPMTDPYLPPTSAAQPATRPATGITWLLAGLVASVLAAAAVTIIGVFVVPQFSEVYQAFGTGLPLATKLFVRCYWLVWVAPIAVIVAWCFWPSVRRRHMMGGLLGIGILLTAVPLAILALYLPLFSLSSAV